jgi:hypothetical protein
MTTRTEALAIKNTQAWEDLDNAGGIIAFGSWQTGTGNFKKARDIPARAAVFSKPHSDFSRGQMPAHVAAWFDAHPRAQRCVALVG